MLGRGMEVNHRRHTRVSKRPFVNNYIVNQSINQSINQSTTRSSPTRLSFSYTLSRSHSLPNKYSPPTAAKPDSPLGEYIFNPSLHNNTRWGELLVASSISCICLHH